MSNSQTGRNFFMPNPCPAWTSTIFTKVSCLVQSLPQRSRPGHRRQRAVSCRTAGRRIPDGWPDSTLGRRPPPVQSRQLLLGRGGPPPASVPWLRHWPPAGTVSAGANMMKVLAYRAVLLARHVFGSPSGWRRTWSKREDQLVYRERGPNEQPAVVLAGLRQFRPSSRVSTLALCVAPPAPKHRQVARRRLQEAGCRIRVRIRRRWSSTAASATFTPASIGQPLAKPRPWVLTD